MCTPVAATVHSTDAEQVREVAVTLRWWLDLDTDPTLILAALSPDLVVGPYSAPGPGSE